MWTPIHDRKDFSAAIGNLKTGAGTNLEAAFKLGHQLASRGGSELTHLYFVTDGEPSVGISSLAWFQEQAKKQESAFTWVGSIGLRSSYNLRLMEALGNFTHIESDSAIPTAIGQLIGSLMTTRFIGCHVVPEPNLVGNPKLGHFPAGNTYSWLWQFKVPSELPEVSVVYGDLVSGKFEVLKAPADGVKMLEAPSADMQRHYFTARGGEFCKHLAACFFAQDEVKKVEKLISVWETKHVMALPVVQQVRLRLPVFSLRSSTDPRPHSPAKCPDDERLCRLLRAPAVDGFHVLRRALRGL